MRIILIVFSLDFILKALQLYRGPIFEYFKGSTLCGQTDVGTGFSGALPDCHRE